MKFVWTALLLMFSVTTIVVAQETTVVAEAFRIVNIRSGPSTADAIIGQLSPGEATLVLARNNENSDWLLIQTNGVTGWIAYFVVSVTGDATTLPIVLSEALVPVQENPVEAEANLLESAVPLVTSVTATTFRRANIRSLPDIDAPILVVVQRGEVLQVIGRSNADNDWLQVETPRGTGWIAYFLVSVEGELDQLPVAAFDEGVSQNTQIDTISVTTRFNANLRAQPLFNADILRTIPFSTVISANGRSVNGDWIRVSYQGEQGWVLRALISSSDEIEQLAVAE